MSVSVSQTLNHNNSSILEYNNYPTLQKKDTFYYRGLDSSDFPIRKFKQIDTKRDYSLNNYSLDIDGASPKKYGIYNHKPLYTNSNTDIEKSSPSILNKYINKPDFTLSNGDIENSKPQGHHCFKNDRHLNPLCPEYKLPTFTEKNVEEYKNKFIRDNIDVSDIEGATPKKYLKWDKRDNLNIFNEKEEENYKLKKLNKKGEIYNYLDYRDVYQKKNLDEEPKYNMHNEIIEKRHSNPLDPIYKVTYRGGEKYIYGEIEGSKPCSFSKFNTVGVGKGNSTDDIEGAQPDTKTPFEKFQLKWKRPLKYIAEDIVGAKHDTKIRGINTNRRFNPLVPKYQYPGVLEEREKNKIQNNRYINTVGNVQGNEIVKSQEINFGNEKLESNNNLNEVKVAQSQIIGNNNTYNVNIENNLNENNNNNVNESNLVNNNNNCVDGDNLNNNNNNLNNSVNSINSDGEKLTIEELKKMPFYENHVEFDKDKYKKPEVYKNLRHDKALIAQPPNKKALADYYNSRQNPTKSPQRQMPSSLEDRNYIKVYYNPFEHQLDKFMKKNC